MYQKLLLFFNFASIGIRTRNLPIGVIVTYRMSYALFGYVSEAIFKKKQRYVFKK